MSELLSHLAGNELAGFILVLARVTPLFVLAPVFSSRLVPARVRGIIAVAISIGLAPVALRGQHIPSQPFELFGLILQSIIVGLAYSLALAVLMAAIESAGGFIDVIAGFSYGGLINPMSGEQSAVMARFYALVGTVVFMVIGGDAWILRGLGRSFDLVPLTGTIHVSSMVGALVAVFGTVFTGALEVAAPVLIALLVTDVAFGVVSRVVPQMNVFAVAFPAKVGVALFVVGASVPFFANWINDQLSTSVAAALGVLHAA